MPTMWYATKSPIATHGLCPSRAGAAAICWGDFETSRFCQGSLGAPRFKQCVLDSEKYNFFCFGFGVILLGLGGADQVVPGRPLNGKTKWLGQAPQQLLGAISKHLDFWTSLAFISGFLLVYQHII